jgi:small subunit ribosomal protein S8
MMNDLLSDMLARIKNGQHARLPQVTCNFSKLLANVLEVLKREGFIADWRKSGEGNKPNLEIDLKYFEGEAAIKEIKRVSKPGRRVYSPISELQKVMNGLGISILSTSKGVMSDYDARQAGVGGEVLCTVF